MSRAGMSYYFFGSNDQTRLVLAGRELAKIYVEISTTMQEPEEIKPPPTPLQLSPHPHGGGISNGITSSC